MKKTLKGFQVHHTTYEHLYDELHHMDDPFAPPSGTVGEVMFVDDIGQIHVKWENGSSLALNVKLDSFSRI